MKAIKSSKLICSVSLFFLMMVRAQASTHPEPLRNLKPLNIEVVLSPAAIETLTSGNESVEIAASWYGWPASKRRVSAEEVGQIELGSEYVYLPAWGGQLALMPPHLNKERLSWLRGTVYINVNVYSSRHYWPDNLLSCDFIEGELTEIQQHQVTLNCALIKEKQPALAILR